MTRDPYSVNPIKAYKIVEVVDGKIKSLFHGLNGSRTMPEGVWIKADERMVRDGTGDRMYVSGWHVFLELHQAIHYLKRFTARPDLLKVVECKVRGIRPKYHSPAPVILARRIMF